MVDEEHLSTSFDEIARKIHQLTSLEVERVHVHIETLTQARVKILFGIGEQKGSASHSSGTTNTNQSIAPIDGVHQSSTHRGAGMLNEVGMGLKKGLHN